MTLGAVKVGAIEGRRALGLADTVALPAPQKPCCYPGCAKFVVIGKLACIRHWFDCPPGVREAMWRLYRQAWLTSDAQPSVVFGEHGRSAIRELALAHWAYDRSDDGAIEKGFEHLERAVFQRKRALSAGERDPFEGLEATDVLFDLDALTDTGL